MQNHLPTLETCQNLKEAGFPHETEFFWREIDGMEPHLVFVGHPPESMRDWYENTLGIACAAPILTEILEQLPTVSQVDLSPMSMRKTLGGFVVEFEGEQQHSDNPAEAAAQLWLKLKEGDAK